MGFFIFNQNEEPKINNSIPVVTSVDEDIDSIDANKINQISVQKEQPILVQNEKFLGVPNYKDREITEGSVFHVITYGLNSMGSHANQLSQDERWQVTDYVLKLKSGL